MNRKIKVLLCFLWIFNFVPVRIWTQSTPFQKSYFFSPYIQGSNKFVHTNFYCIEALKDGGFATLGFLTDTNNVSQGFLTKYDCIGNIFWTKLLGPNISPTNTVMGISEADNGDLVISFPIATGFFQASTLIGRFDPDGKTKWMKRIGNNTEFGRDIVKTNDGGFIIAGSTGFYGSDTGADDIYLFKIDSTGNILWSKTFGNPGSTFDEAFAVALDSKQNIIVSGRCIADGTFQTFILKADTLGNPIKFKTFGFNNQRTYGFALLVDPNDNYLVTGSTTILEIDHSSSEYDVFLIKTDSELNSIFNNIYEVNLGSDAGSIGEGLTYSSDGKYVIGVSTYAFSTHNASGPNSPSKNALYVINQDGSIYKAIIYNMKGSQYTRVQKTMEGFYVCGFSTAYANNVNFQGLIIKTDNNYLSGCNDIDVTSELSLYQEPWIVDTFKYQIKSGHRSVNYSIEKDTNLQFNTICETKIELNPQIVGPTMACLGDKVIIRDLSTGSEEAKHTWLVNGQPAGEGKMDLEFTITQAGKIQVSKVMSYACISKSQGIIIDVPNTVREIYAELCPGKSYNFFGKSINQEGRYVETIEANPCDSFIVLNLKYLPEEIVDINVEICEGKTYEFDNRRLNQSGVYSKSDIRDGCNIVLRLNLLVKEAIVDEVIKDTIFCEVPVVYKNISYNFDRDTTLRIPKEITNDGCITKVDLLHIVKDLVLVCEDCVQFPNVVTPSDQNQNNVFKPVFENFCESNMSDYEFKIFNRWGELVYESKDAKNTGWNCQYNDKPASMDSYVYTLNYILKFTDKIFRRYEHSGMFTIIR